MEEHEKINLRSEEVSEILGRPPSWIIRWGITVFFLTLVTILVISYLVKYPDSVEAPILLTTPSPPTKVVAEQSGRLLQFNVKNEEKVMKGSLIAVLESGASYDDMIRLDKKLTRAVASQTPFQPPRRLELGEVQLAFSSYQRDYKDYIFKSKNRFDKEQVEQIYQLQRMAEKKMNIARDKERKLKNNLGKAYSKIQRFRNMVESGQATLKDLEDVRTEYQNMERGLEDIQSEIVKYESEIEEYDSQKLKVQRSTAESGNDRLIRLQDSMNRLAAEVNNWKKKYLIYAPVGGKVTLFDIRTEQQYIKQGQDIMLIVSEQDEILGMMGVPVTGAGKIEKGDIVNISLHEYPAKEYGVVKGEVSRISLVPKDNNYLVEISLPEELKTTYGKQLDFKQEMSGTGKIITDEKRFLYRVFEQLYDLVRVS